MLPGEQVIWRGRPAWRALARDVMHARWVALYAAAFLLWGAYADRSHGLGPMRTLVAGIPMLVLGSALLGACAAFAWLCARTTTYTVTNQRCVLSFGMALTATLSLPLRSIATVSVRVHADGTGDIPLALKSGGRKVAFLKLWPHARPWQLSRPQPMLRGVPDAAAIAGLLGQAASAVSPGHMASGIPAAGKRRAVSTRPAIARAG